MWEKLTVAESVERLHQFHYGIDRLMHITASWIPAVPETFVKSGLGRALYLDSLCIDLLLKRLSELRDDSDHGEASNADYVHLTNCLTSLTTTADRLQARQAVQRNIADELQEHVTMTDPLWDEPTLRMVKRLREYLEEEIDILDDIIPLAQDSTTESLDQALHYLQKSGGICGPKNDMVLPPEAPFQLVDTPVREPGLMVKHASQFPRASEVPKEKSLIVQLHSITYCVEVVAVEICSQIIAEHPEIPWSFKMDLARQIYDEARHTELLARRIEELGGKLGEYPVHIHIWEYFQLGDDLTEQLAIQQVIQEGHGLDSDIVFSKYMAEIGDMETSILFDFVGADEVVHVRLGCRWMHYLSNGVRKTVTDAINKGYDKLLARQYSPKFPVQEQERLIAGMTIEQIERAKEVVFSILNQEMKKIKQPVAA